MVTIYSAFSTKNSFRPDLLQRLLNTAIQDLREKIVISRVVAHFALRGKSARFAAGFL